MSLHNDQIKHQEDKKLVFINTKFFSNMFYFLSLVQKFCNRSLLLKENTGELVSLNIFAK